MFKKFKNILYYEEYKFGYTEIDGYLGCPDQKFWGRSPIMIIQCPIADQSVISILYDRL